MKRVDYSRYCFASEMDDNLKYEIHHHTGVPGCMGPVCAYDTPIIETIAKPALPAMVRWYSLTMRREMRLCLD